MGRTANIVAMTTTTGKKLSPPMWTALLAAMSLLLPAVTSAQVGQAGNVAMPSLAADFGAVGLVGEMNSAEHYGALQSRLGAYNAADTGDARLDTLVVPVNAIMSLDAGGEWFAKIGTVYIDTDGAYPDGSTRETTSGNFLLQALYRPAAGTLIGLGYMPDRTDISIPASSGNVDAERAGLRFDLLQRMGARSGLAAKLIYLEGDSTFSRPLPNGQMLANRSDTTRIYLEVTVTTIFGREQIAFVPQGWSLRPVTHVLYQRDHERNQQGATSSEDFAQWLLTARMQRDVFRPGQFGPYVELGTELELVNDLAAGGNDDLLIYGKVGAAFLAGNWGRFDAYYARRQAPDDGFVSDTVNLLLSMNF